MKKWQWRRRALVCIAALVVSLNFISILQALSIPDKSQDQNDFMQISTVREEPLSGFHLHGGARDVRGKLGYVHNSTIIHNLSFANMSTACHLERPDGLDEALRKIQVCEISSSKIRLFCMIYTHSNRHHIVRTIADTWGRRCDGFMAASNVTDARIGAVDLTHAGPESYGNMWQKVRSMWAYVHDHFLEEYDFFHVGGDDMYLIPENLKHYAASLPNATKPIYMGGPIASINGRPRRRYCGGGSGYTLNREAIKLLVPSLLPTCQHNATKSGEDYTVALCFLEKGVKCMDTSDPAYRYHAQDALYQASWTWNASPYNIHQDALKRYHGMNPQEGIDGISRTSISFHLKQMKPEQHSSGWISRLFRWLVAAHQETYTDEQWTVDMMLRYHAIIFRHCS